MIAHKQYWTFKKINLEYKYKDGKMNETDINVQLKNH